MDENAHFLYVHYKDLPTDTLLAYIWQLMQEVEQTQNKISKLTEVLNNRGIDVASVDFAALSKEKNRILCIPLETPSRDYAIYPSYKK